MNFGSGRVPPGPRFRRAIATGNLFLAELAVREMRDPLPLNDALDLVFVIAEQEPDLWCGGS